MAYILNQEERAALQDVADDLGIQPESLYRLINFESKWDPLAANPRSSAKGLIQFIDSTAQWLGYKDSAELVDRAPTVVAQLTGPVREYLRRHGPYDTEYSLFMAVFYPAAVTWPPDQEFPAAVQEVNPGIKTPADYVAMVYNAEPLTQNEIRSAIGPAVNWPVVVAIAAAAGIVLYVLNA
jgi:hypothetical protein